MTIERSPDRDDNRCISLRLIMLLRHKHVRHECHRRLDETPHRTDWYQRVMKHRLPHEPSGLRHGLRWQLGVTLGCIVIITSMVSLSVVVGLYLGTVYLIIFLALFVWPTFQINRLLINILTERLIFLRNQVLLPLYRDCQAFKARP